MAVDPETTDRDGLPQRRDALRERLATIRQDYTASSWICRSHLN